MTNRRVSRRTGSRPLRTLSVALAAAGAAIGLAAAPAGAAGGWEPVPDPDSSRWFDAFLPVGDAVFARGGFYPGGDPGSGEVASYWLREGTTWKELPRLANQSLETNEDGIWTATSARDFWVIGSMAATPTIANHWNGSAWQDRSPADKTVMFRDIKAVSANDVWAVGTTQWTTTTQTQSATIGRWNGSSWKITKLPQAEGGRTQLQAVQVNSASDVWAAGRTCPTQSTQNCRGYMTRWNGSTWTEVPLPAGTGTVTELTADASGKVWAAAGTSVLRWSGTGWDTSAAVKVTGANGVDELTWAGGKLYAGLSLNGNNTHSGIVRWNGTAWENVARPIDDTSYYYVVRVTSLAGASDGSLWASGLYSALWSTPTFAARLPAGAMG
ncbi:hypothetical protein ACH4E5_13800 [Streptomyces afghaniensis]|uniref:hypothetical protein n=1 Tax=Streptomyces afghaniensis TaxID=66865 RepID=UPI00379939F7